MRAWVNRIHLGDCRDLLPEMLADGVRVNMCVTSPPYFGLRDYRAYGQIGLESDAQTYLAQLVGVFRWVRGLLRNDGSLWLVVGDCYSSAPGKAAAAVENPEGVRTVGAWEEVGRGRRQGVKPKDLLGLPWRLAVGLQEDGWYLRCDVIWNKPNPRPESAPDRPTRCHEYVFLFTKSPAYYFDAEAVREPTVSLQPGAKSYRPNSVVIAREGRREYSGKHRMSARSYNPAGRNVRSVWTIPTVPYKGAHFATFPPDLVRRCVLAGSSSRGHCSLCGLAWRRSPLPREGTAASTAAVEAPWRATCRCGGAVPARALVLDPFMGSGTTAEVATGLGRDFTGCEIQPGYRALYERRRVTLGMSW